MTRSALFAAVLLVLGVTSAAAADTVKLPDCPSGMAPRLCLTLIAGTTAQTQSEAYTLSERLAELADMQRADRRDDLARETLRLASDAAVKAPQNIGKIAIRRFALGDMQAAEDGLKIIARPEERASVLNMLLDTALGAGDREASEQFIRQMRQVADEAGRSRNQIYASLLATLTKHGRHERATAIAQALADPAVTSQLRAGRLRTALQEKLERGLFGEAETLVMNEAPSNQQLWQDIAGAAMQRKDYGVAVAVVEQHINNPENEPLLARAYLGKGDIDAAVRLAEQGSKDQWVDWEGIWTDIAIAQAKAGLINAAAASLPHVMYQRADVRAAITVALVQAGRKREAIAMAKAAFDLTDESINGHWNGESGSAEAFLAVQDFKTAVALAGKSCLLGVPLEMVERRLQEGNRKDALAILDATTKAVPPCLGKTDHPDPIPRFLCAYAELKPTDAALARAAEVAAKLESWREQDAPAFYACLARARAKSGDVAGAHKIARGAPTPDAVRTALLAVTEFEADRDPSRAAELYRALLADNQDNVRAGYAEWAIHGLMNHLKCQYGGSCAKK